ncbi:MAG TPA: DUF1573 domain-containing protein, partial [Candidatus Binataceae bacterium]|nr:DUF1573 domain-containing protein [Candidatus Binataceae bacterium]
MLDRDMGHRISRVLSILAIVILAALPAAAQEDFNPLIPGGNSAPPGEAPLAVVPEPLFNFGTALEGTMVRHTFKVENTGKGYLDIRGVKTSCGCTAAKPTKTHLAPGESSEIAVGFDTRFESGHQERVITASTNDPKNPEIKMTMQGTIKPQVAAVPKDVDFGSVKKGTGAEKTVMLEDLMPEKEKFKAGPATNSNHSIKATLEPRTDGKPGEVLHVALLPSMPIGPFDDTIKIVNNRMPLQVDVFGAVKGDLTVSPQQVSFGIVSPGQGAVRILRLTNSSASRAIRVLNITSDNVLVTATAEPVEDGKQYKITVTLGHSAAEG